MELKILVEVEVEVVAVVDVATEEVEVAFNAESESRRASAMLPASDVVEVAIESVVLPDTIMDVVSVDATYPASAVTGVLSEAGA